MVSIFLDRAGILDIFGLHRKDGVDIFGFAPELSTRCLRVVLHHAIDIF